MKNDNDTCQSQSSAYKLPCPAEMRRYWNGVSPGVGNVHGLFYEGEPVYKFFGSVRPLKIDVPFFLIF